MALIKDLEVAKDKEDFNVGREGKGSRTGPL